MHQPRYAIYFTPPSQSALWQFGSAVVGYDSVNGQRIESPAIPGFSRTEWQELTAEPRRYGFHATIKAPFRLSEQRSEHELRAHLRSSALALKAIIVPALVIAEIGDFIALVPKEPSTGLQALAFQVVESFEPFRAPLNEAEIARRMRSPLTPRQQTYLAAYGYPYVSDEFRFHMTLTGMIKDQAARACLREILAVYYAKVAGNGVVSVGGLSLMRQPAPDLPFHLFDQVSLPFAEPAANLGNSA